MSTRFARLDEIAGQERRILRLTGGDTERFLQGTLTAELSNLEAARAVPAALLTVKAKLVTEIVALRVGPQTVDLLVPAQSAAALAENLERHIIMDDVEVEPPHDTGVAVAWGGAVPPQPPPVRVFEARHPAPTHLVLGPAADLPTANADEAEYTTHRIDTATPAWGHEITPDFFPPEMGYVYAVSYDKGCFLGQEPLSRIHSRSQFNRVMVRVTTDAPAGAQLTHPDRPKAGRLTTSCRGAGLAVIRREVATEGNVLTTDDGAEVLVASGPLGDDPGIHG